MRKPDEASGPRRLARPLGDRLSYANVTATLALFVALGGGSFAVATLSHGEKKVVKKVSKAQANKRITAREPGLSVKHAGSADSATDAGHASSADSATNAEHAKAADTATTAGAVTCEPPVAGTGDMVKAGAVCIDKYEASVWSQPTGGTQYGVNSDDYPCNDNGQDCTNIYARSVPGVTPSRSITWFQAQQALANSGRRLPTNAEWQQAVRGTPDSSACNISTGSVANTGANANCVSDFGAFDMVGNVWEWVADWDEEAGGCVTWSAGFGSDLTCIGRGSGEASTRLPGALIRGGAFGSSSDAGPFALSASNRPSASPDSFGFRGVR